MKRLAALVVCLGLFAVPEQAQSQDSRVLDLLNSMPSSATTVGRGGWCMPTGATLGHTVLRLQTQLLVTSLSCGDAYRSSGLYDRYVAFTETQSSFLDQARFWVEQQSRADGHGTEGAFTNAQMAIANLEAAMITQMGQESYCRIRQPRFDTLIGTSAESFRAYATDVHGRNTASGRECLSMVD